MTYKEQLKKEIAELETEIAVLKDMQPTLKHSLDYCVTTRRHLAQILLNFPG